MKTALLTPNNTFPLGTKSKGKLNQRNQHQEVSTQQLQCWILNRIIQFLDTSPLDHAFVCREAELQQLLIFLQKVLLTKCTPGENIIQIHGQPGTGKTYTVQRALSILSKEKSIYEDKLDPILGLFCIVNGALISSPLDLFVRFVEIVVADTSIQARLVQVFKVLGLHEAFKQLSQHRKDNGRKLVVVLDEVDQLLNQKKSGKISMENVVNQVRDFAMKGFICIICISNVLHFKGPLSVKSGAESSCHQIIFEPYTEQQLRQILDRRIQLAKDGLSSQELSNYFEFILYYDPFDSSAKTFAVKRVAAQKGDCRQLLNTCRHLVSQKLVELQTTKKRKRAHRYPSLLQTHYTCLEDDDSLESSSPMSSIRSSEKSTFSESSSPSKASQDSSSLSRINFHSTVRLLNDKLEYSQANCLNMLKNLPLHQQILMCAVCTAIQRDQEKQACYSSSVDIHKVQNIYTELCQEHTMPIQYNNQIQFVEALHQLESMGIIRLMYLPRKDRKSLTDAKSTRTSVIELCFDVDSLCEILKRCKQIFNLWLDEL